MKTVLVTGGSRGIGKCIAENLAREGYNVVLNYNKSKKQAEEIKQNLEKDGINVRIIDMHTIKPIDKELIVKCAKETKKIITIEDHNIIGGLGSSISEVLTDEYPTKLIRLGINDTFGKSGKAEELMKYFHIVSDDIIREVIN